MRRLRWRRNTHPHPPAELEAPQVTTAPGIAPGGEPHVPDSPARKPHAATHIRVYRPRAAPANLLP